MMQWLTNPLNVLIVAVTVLACLAMVLVAIQKGLKLKVSKEGVSAEDTPDEPMEVERRKEPPCMDYVAEHSKTLQQQTELLQQVVSLLKVHGEEIRSVYVMMKPLLDFADVVLGQYEGEKINGQMAATRTKLRDAQVTFDEATIGKTGRVVG